MVPQIGTGSMPKAETQALWYIAQAQFLWVVCFMGLCSGESASLDVSPRVCLCLIHVYGYLFCSDTLSVRCSPFADGSQHVNTCSMSHNNILTSDILKGFARWNQWLYWQPSLGPLIKCSAVIVNLEKLLMNWFCPDSLWLFSKKS